jgi:hypothetical protein
MPWTSPLTKSGRSALVPEGPWIYAFDTIGVYAVGDTERLKEALPDFFSPTGDMWFYFAEIISQSPNCPELNYEAPGLVQYNEAAIFVKVNYKKREYAYCPFMYVDNDVSLMRGYVVGFPKKLASIHITRKHDLMNFKKFGGVASRAGYPLLKMVVEPEKPTEKLPFDNFGTWILRRYIKLTNTDDIVEFIPEVEYGKILEGDAELRVFGGINDELHLFDPVDVRTGYVYSALLKVREIRVL